VNSFPPRLKKTDARATSPQTRVTCRVMAELGADIIKTVYTGERFTNREKHSGAAVVLGAEKMPREEQASRIGLRRRS